MAKNRVARSGAGSAGGRANEAGGLHRAGVALYIAAHGLASRPLVEAGYPPDAGAPIAVEFETKDAVDDIRCTMADGSSLLIQAKSACGKDRHLQATVRQWVAHIPVMQPGDRLALATAQAKGPVKALGSALERRRLPRPGEFTPDENKALDALRWAFAPEVSRRIQERVLDAATVLGVAVSTDRDVHFNLAAILLDGLTEPHGGGLKAAKALRDDFREQATAGTGSGIDDWLTIIANAGISIRADADGAVGPRRQAERQAVRAYRAHLAKWVDTLEYSLLAERLEPMKVPNLVRTFRIVRSGDPQRRSNDLVDIARRWNRMLLTGLPGTGKSTALEQLAALWAAQPNAPVPIHVRLLRVAESIERPADITLPLLIEKATAGVPIGDSAPLRRALEEAASRGEAILLLDGLDETRAGRGTVTNGLLGVFNGLPCDTGVIITTRGSALPAAEKLDFPRTELVEPSGITSTLNQLVSHFAEHRVPAKAQQQWIEECTGWLRRARRGNTDIWSVPLFATLLTLLAAERGTDAVPVSRAELLAQAVQDSVKRWEYVRPTLSAGTWNTKLKPGMLIDGYQEIGHLLNARGSETAAEVTRSVAGMLASRWLLSPGECEEVADEVTRFWDDQTGVFVRRDGGRIEPRSRVYAEIGDAMWIARQDESIIKEWIADAVLDEERRETTLLAAGLSPAVVAALIDVSATPASHDFADAYRALFWTAEALSTGCSTDHERLTAVIHALATAARLYPPARTATPRRGYSAAFRRDNPSWRFTYCLASLRLTTHVRAQRDHALDSLALEEDQRAIARALAALADAATDGLQQLDAEAISAVNAMLELVTPSTDAEHVQPAAQNAERRGPWAGHINAAEQAIPFLGQCISDAAERVEALAYRGSAGQYDHITASLNARGYPVRTRLTGIEWSTFNSMAARTIEPFNQLYGAAAKVSEPGELTLTERWRLPDMCRLADAIELSQASLEDIIDLGKVDPAHLVVWVAAVARSSGLDLSSLAAQAAFVLSDANTDHLTFKELLLAIAPCEPSFETAGLTHGDLEALIASLDSRSRLVADTATRILHATQDASIGARIETLLPTMAAPRRGNAAVLVCLLHPDLLTKIEQYLDQHDCMLRVGAGHALRYADARHERTRRLLARAQTDEDMSVRIAAGTPQERSEQALHWSCLDCGATTPASTTKCNSCNQGTRPTQIGESSLTELLGP